MNVHTNMNSSSITFYCPNHLKNSFDELVRFKRISRTSIINYLMENWMRTEYQKLKDDEQISDLIENVKSKNIIQKNQITNDRPTQWSVKSKQPQWEDTY